VQYDPTAYLSDVDSLLRKPFQMSDLVAAVARSTAHSVGRKHDG
jgi:hypothetical protein